MIETPNGCGNKYKLDPELDSFVLSSVLPEGMIFPLKKALKSSKAVRQMGCNNQASIKQEITLQK